MTNRKAAYLDFSKPEYQTLSDDEVQTLKAVNSKGNRKNLRVCQVHGITEPVFAKSYDRNGRETNFFTCPKCLSNFGDKNAF
jgi:hypothetical protein